jgi:hypothetical protein
LVLGPIGKEYGNSKAGKFRTESISESKADVGEQSSVGREDGTESTSLVELSEAAILRACTKVNDVPKNGAMTDITDQVNCESDQAPRESANGYSTVRLLGREKLLSLLC